MTEERSGTLLGLESGALPPLLALFEHMDTGSGEGESMLLPFAFEETLCRDVGTGAAPPAAHIWRHGGGVALGLRDSKLPFAAGAMGKLEAQGYRTAVRHSGGAAVPLDSGVVNVALVLPKGKGVLDFHRDFRLLSSLIAEAVSLTHPAAAALIEAREISGSYCPGDFDLSIGGRKFCGIAQRRQNDAYFVHAFVTVSGSGAERGSLIRGFYEEAAGGRTDISYPEVRPDTLASLAELGGPGDPQSFARSFRDALLGRGTAVVPDWQLARAGGYRLDYRDGRVQEAERRLRERYGQ